MAATAREGGAADDDGGDRVELGELSVVRRSGVRQAGDQQPAEACGEPTQDVHRDQHA